MPSFPRDRLDALQPLLDEINSYLDSLGWSARLGASSLPAKGAPVVDVRSSEEQHGSHERAAASDDQPLTMQLWITKPAAGWRDTLTQIAERADIEYVLYLALGFSEYSGYSGFLLRLDLGTGYKTSWTGDIGKPVEVLHIKGMLLDREGNIVRAGAEGIIAPVTPFVASLFGAQTIISAGDIGRLLTEERRDDLPGQPLTWKVSTQNLLAQLLIREEVLR